MARSGRPVLAPALALVALLALLAVAAPPAAAVNVAQSVIVSADPVDWTPHVVDGEVDDIVQIGSRIYAGGTFSEVRQTPDGPNISRSFLFAFDATTGAIDERFAPRFDGPVMTLAVSPDGNLFVGGVFNRVNGDLSPKLVELGAASGNRIARFDATADAAVRELIVRGRTLYAGGIFTHIGGVKRRGLAALDATTGRVGRDFQIRVARPRRQGTTPGVYAMDVTSDGSTMIVLGNFRRVGGQDRSQAAMIDLGGKRATVEPWATRAFAPQCGRRFWTYMRDVDFSPDGRYFAIVTSGGYSGGPDAGVVCDTASRWETRPRDRHARPTWVNYTGGDTLTSVALTGAAVYVGGHQRWVNNPDGDNEAGPGAIARSGLAALDPDDGQPFPWDPGRDRGAGVGALYATQDGLWVGSDTDVLAGETHRKIGMFPVAGGAPAPTTD